MRVLALTRTSDIGPSTRYRIEQYRPRLRELGIEVETQALFGPTWFRILDLDSRPVQLVLKSVYSAVRLAVRGVQALRATRSDADVVLIEQQLFPYLPSRLESLLWPRNKPTILEFDDAIYLTPGHRGKLQDLCARASVVIVGNRVLEEFAAPHARRTFVIPTTLDLEGYDAALEAQRRRRAGFPDRFRVGWIGLRYNFPFLAQLRGPLAALGPGCELRVISSGLPPGDWRSLPVVLRPWSRETEAADLADCDVGVMPLPDTPWARGKCALKLLQYMAAGVPVVASPVGMNAELIRHEENGLLARSEHEWEQALRSLAADSELRNRLGEAGRRTVEAGYSLQQGAEKVAEAYGFAFRSADGNGEPDPPAAASNPR